MRSTCGHHSGTTTPKTFVWTKTVDDIITKAKRGRATLDRVTESATHLLARVLARVIADEFRNGLLHALGIDRL